MYSSTLFFIASASSISKSTKLPSLWAITLFDLPSQSEKVHVLIYRLYIFDEEKTYLMENSEMQEQDVFYI